jgi:CHAT domain-containing protein
MADSIKQTFQLKWDAGANAQIEILRPGAEQFGVYQLKYAPPFRTTLRPPLQDSNLGDGEFAQIDDRLEKLVQAFDLRDAGGNTAVPAGALSPGSAALVEMQQFGEILYNLAIPDYIQSDLRNELFLDIGMDEMLLGYPWELMHDGEEFLCLKHNVGRFVNTSSPRNSSSMNVVGWRNERFEKLSILLIAVPNPQPRQNSNIIYNNLPAAESEANAIVKTLTDLDGVSLEVLIGKEATYTKLFNALTRRLHHIIHFCGHARFDGKTPRLSSLVLYDQDITTAAVLGFVSKSRPLFCFVNGCETAKTPKSVDRFNVYSLARAFLETGAYLLGSRWKVSDKAAAAFAAAWYTSLIEEGRPLGSATRAARLKCKDAIQGDLGWASYVLYGDPRVCFSRSAK